MKFRTTMKSIEYNGIERPEYTPDMISELKADEVFVFGAIWKECTEAERHIWHSRNLERLWAVV